MIVHPPTKLGLWDYPCLDARFAASAPPHHQVSLFSLLLKQPVHLDLREIAVIQDIEQNVLIYRCVEHKKIPHSKRSLSHVKGIARYKMPVMRIMIYDNTLFILDTDENTMSINFKTGDKGFEGQQFDFSFKPG